MEALLFSALAAFLATWGDKSQLLVAHFSTATRKPAQIFAGLFLAALASSVVAAIAGAWIAQSVTIRAMTLMVALALAFAAVAGLFHKAPQEKAPARWPLAATFVLCLAAEIGGSAQFLTFALAGRFAAAPLAAAGATAGIAAACLPAVLLGQSLRAALPVRAIRYAAAAVFLITGFVTAVSALQLT